MKTIATRVYGAADIAAEGKILKQIQELEEGGYGRYPICVAKTQYSSARMRRSGVRQRPCGEHPRGALGRRR